MEENDKIRRLIITSFYIVILFGLPLWWKTTEVYRAQLPFTEIEEWSNWEAFDLEFPTHFTIYVANVKPSTIKFANLSSNLENLITSRYNIDNSKEANNGTSQKSIRFPVKIKLADWNNWMNDLQDGNLEMGNLANKNGQYSFYILPRTKSNSDTKVLVGNQRQAIVEINQWDTNVIEKTISDLIISLFMPEQDAIRKSIIEPLSDSKVELDSMRTMKYSSQYQVTFSLMNGDPSNLLVNWDIEEAVNKYLGPFVNQISMISNLTVDSQIQHYARLTFEPNHKPDENYFFLTPELLPHFINAAEWNLASAVSSYPTLNFILYVPSKEQSPLHIQDSKGNIMENNAFLIPRWGGVIINNPDRSKGTHNFSFKELKSVMSIFITQLRGLLGVHDVWIEAKHTLGATFSIEFVIPPNTAVTMWEFDNLVRRRIAENIVTSITTLKSLSQLVTEIPNMVVLDHIQTEVFLALDNLSKSCKHLHNNQYDLALYHSKKAIELAESAFFDPTMVSMLYFPDEHKYAIYMPLFVPISVPLLVALQREVKSLKKK
ncbi:phosphatidylinositol-glycan biosynthesis class S protein [Glomus cerebriforme]|uniref:Phosphatidylinositol-glycan biosynthesis class S protein n=1 Tax=Glomus cerebriforme TaxID=658196 RepID=A0A397TB48_9GLOM|nr:phosphatidylinositol-glycan biosynthesis class S protein [Glomus cerebriforme]RIA95480.1 phosphatidylinositol-glycan biosynthesis class S protein [Glomus cerebriforme]